ncbi:MAG: hypothetical protein Hens2KO_29400 [Henriciella sp.]
MLKSVFISVFAVGTLTPFAFAACDISQTKCALNGGKCNIQFKNKTGDAGGSDGGTSVQQTSSAQTIVVKAKDDATDRVGNRLKIPAGAKKTMNMDKKAGKKGGFATISIASQDFNVGVAGADMSCEDIKAVLNGNGTCKIFHGMKKGAGIDFRLGFQCDGGNVAGPTK